MKISIPLLACISVLTLSACGGSSGGNTNPSSSAVSSAIASSSSAAEVSSSSDAVESSSSAVSSTEESSSSASSEASSSESSAIESSSSESSLSESSSSDSSSSSSSSAPVISSSSSAISSSSSTSSSSSSVSSSSVSSSSSESSSSESSSSAAAVGWIQVWEDTFDEPNIDPTKWEHEVNCWGGGNNEAQCYTANPNNSYVADGLLHLSAIYEGPGQVCGPALNQEDPGYPGATICKDYSSARLRTRGMGDWTYGRMEIRAKMPHGKGIWPAIWMLPTDTTTYGGWPHSGEIDIFEAFEPGVAGPQPTGGENEIHGTLHYGYSWPWNQYSGAPYTPPTNIWDDFYTYAVEWEEGEIRWYVDDVLFARNSGNWFIYYWGGQEIGYQVGTGAQPFDNPFHMILNVALGNGDYVALPEFTDTRTMAVDYVRVFECSVDPLTGKGCATPTADVNVTPTNIVGHVPPPDVREEMWLFRGSHGGVQTLTFDVNGDDVENTLQYQEYNPGGALASDLAAAPIDAGSGGAIVWDIQFSHTDVGVAWLRSGDMSGVAGVLDGFNFGSDPVHNRPRNLGEFKFDIWVESADVGAKLQVKLNSTYPNLSFDEVTLTPAMVGQWTPVAVRFNTLRPNPNEAWGPTVDYSSVMHPFEVELVGGAAHVQLDNIRIACLEDCDIKPKLEPIAVTDDMNIFVGGLAPEWGNPGFGVYQEAPQAITIDATVSDPDKGTVIEVEFLAAGNVGLFYIQDATPKDLSAFATGNLVFDLKVLTNDNNTDGFLVKADCVHPCSSLEVAVPLPVDNDWHTITVPVANLNHAGFNIANVNTPFAFWPVFNQQGVTFQVANIRWELP